jgi:hypothetical protein
MGYHMKSSSGTFTKHLMLAVGFAGFSVLSPISWGLGTCPVTVADSVEVAGAEFSLTDLLTPDTCAAYRREAAGIRLGGIPLVGSVRVIEGGEVRALLDQLALRLPPTGSARVPERIPERITVRRAGARASCGDIGERILGGLRANAPDSAPSGFGGTWNRLQPDAGNRSAGELDCGAAGRIPREAPLEVIRTAWDAALRIWDVSARCLHPADCVPFLVRVPGRDRGPESRGNTGNSAAARSPATAQPLVRPGKIVTLVWDQDGIRLVVPAVCLDRGGAGQPVRARIVNGGRVVRAIVESAGTVRAAS